MKLETKYKDTSVAIEFTPEEIGKLIPFFIRALFNKKTATTKTYSLLENVLIECQSKCGWKKFTFEKFYLRDQRIILLIEQMPFFIKNGVKNKFISEYEIDSYEKKQYIFCGHGFIF